MPMFNWLKSQLPCQLCGLVRAEQNSVCSDCWQNLPWFKSTVIRHEQPIYAACHYQYPIDRIIQQFKYEQQLHYQVLLAGCLAQLKLPKVHAIVPMPISNQRLIDRGYNQSLLVAKILSKKLNIPIWQPIQRQHQHSQKGLSRLERLDQIEQQFQAMTPYNKAYRKVLILDDVVTTGSSIHALRQALITLGCEQVYAACVAYAGE